MCSLGLHSCQSLRAPHPVIAQAHVKTPIARYIPSVLCLSMPHHSLWGLDECDCSCLCACRKRDSVAPGIKQTEIGTEAVVDVAPLAGRLVLFLSGAVEHAVLPNFSQRVALTAWCQ